MTMSIRLSGSWKYLGSQSCGTEITFPVSILSIIALTDQQSFIFVSEGRIGRLILQNAASEILYFIEIASFASSVVVSNHNRQQAPFQGCSPRVGRYCW